MDYQQAQQRLSELSSFGVKPGLQRITELLRRLDNPHLGTTTRFLHVAGTNGKGSVCSMLQAMLLAAGHSTGMFTSPHLSHHCERYRVNGKNMSEQEFVILFAEVDAAIRQMQAAGWESPTEFEAVTALALLFFRQQQVEFAVIETGLGGRLDSSNVILPEITLITNVAMDHMQYLGETIAQIAAEKAGIIKPGVPVITAAEGQALQVIKQRAQELGCRVLVNKQDFSAAPQHLLANSSVCDIVLQDYAYSNLHLSLPGRFQLDNAALAVQAAHLLGIDEAALREGLRTVKWQGRLEVFSAQPLIVLDGAHNEAGFAALAESLQLFWPDKRICCLLGMLADKQRKQAITHILPYVQQVIITPPPFLPRVGDWQSMTDIFADAGIKAATEEDNFCALDLALQQLQEGSCDMLLVCGSLYLIGDIRGELQKRFG